MVKLCRAGILALALFLPSMAPAGTIVTRAFASATLGREWSYTVYLPTGYDTSNMRYPVLYLLHGNGGTQNTWAADGRIQATIEPLLASGDVPPAIVVMPDAGTSWYVDRKEKMETAFFEDLIPDVQHYFRTLENRQGRSIAGMSMGGFGALRFVLKYPEMFVSAALFSPAIYEAEPPELSTARHVGVFGSQVFDLEVWKSLNYPALWQTYLEKHQSVPIYISSGDDDELFIEAEAVKLYELLRANAQPAELRIVDGTHGWAAVEGPLGEGLRYLFRFSARPTLTDVKVAPRTKKGIKHEGK